MLSAFGVQFAPRHEIVAHELVGVSRPGGRIGLVNWTPEGVIGELFKIMGRYLPAPPAFASPPPLWGSTDHVRTPVRGHPRRARLRPRPQPVALRVPRGLGVVHGDRLRPDPSRRARSSPPRAAGRTAARRSLALAERRNEATDGSLHMEAEYLITIAHKVG